MSNDNGGKEKATGMTSSSAPKTPEGEADYLAHQAEQAKQAISRTLDDLKSSLAEGADPRQWAKERPWTTLGTIAALGFVAAYGLVPSREQQALKRLKAIERAIGESEEEARHPEKARSSDSILGGFGQQLLDAVKPALMAALTSTVHSRVAGGAGAQDGEKATSHKRP
jgi:ElaB/YqjD/DUF883 family membrane-anchored ribosome-binding protein